MDSLTINSKDFDGDKIIFDKSEMEKLSKCSSIWNSGVNEDLVHSRKYCEEFILPLKNHTHSTEAGVQEIATCLATEISEEDSSTLVSLCSIYIAPINRDILKQFKGSNRDGNRHMTSGVGDNRQPLSCQSKQRATSGDEKYPSTVHPTSDKGRPLIACSSNKIAEVRNMDKRKEFIRLKKIRKNQYSKCDTSRALKSL